MRLVFEMLTCGGFNGLRVDCGSGFVSVSVGAASVSGSWLPAVSDTIARRVATTIILVGGRRSHDVVDGAECCRFRVEISMS